MSEANTELCFSTVEGYLQVYRDKGYIQVAVVFMRENLWCLCVEKMRELALTPWKLWNSRTCGVYAWITTFIHA